MRGVAVLRCVGLLPPRSLPGVLMRFPVGQLRDADWPCVVAESCCQVACFTGALGCLGIRCGVQARSIRLRRRSGLARPYIAVLSCLMRFTVPSTAPELYSRVSPATTASRSRRKPAVNERSGWLPRLPESLAELDLL